jgi:Calx-beta domain
MTKPVTVDYAATAGSALAGSDFTPVSGTLSFPACADGSPAPDDPCVKRTFSVPVLDDTVADGPKTVNLRLSHAVSEGTRAIISLSSAVLVIADDEAGAQPHPTFQMAVASDVVSEASPNFTVYAVRSGDLANPADVDFATADGAAVAGVDYTATNGTLHFPSESTDAGAAVIQPITVNLLHNTSSGAPATADFSVSLSLPSGSNGVLGSPAGETVTIVNMDGAPVVQWSAASYSVAENAGSVSLTAVVSGSGSIDPSGDLHVDYATAPGSAKPGINYTSQSGTLQFFTDDFAQSVDVPILDDGKAGNTNFTAGLSDSVGGVLGTPSTATVEIRDLTKPYSIPDGGSTPSGNIPSAGLVGSHGGPGGGQVVLGARQSVCGLTVKAAKKQKLLKKKALILKLRSNQACKVGLGTTVKQQKAKKRRSSHAARALRAKGKKVSLSLQPGKARTVKVKFTKKTLKAIRKALRARKRLVATVVVSERVGSAPAQKRTLRITIRR